MKKDPLFLMPGMVWVAIFLWAPMLFLISVSFFTPVKGGGYIPVFTVANYVKMLTTYQYLFVIGNTLRLSLTVTVIAALLGYPMAYYVAIKVKTFRAKSLILLSLCVLFFIDYTIRTLAWYPILGKMGFINYVLMSIGLVEKPIAELLFTSGTLIIVWIQTYVLFMVFPIYLSMLKLDPSYIDAAETLGANSLKSFYHITFKLSAPGLMIGCMFVFIITMADYATPTMMGGGIQTIGLTVVMLMSVLHWPEAAAMATIALAISLAIIFVMLKVVDIKRLLY